VGLPVAAMSTNDPVRAGSDATAGAPTELRTVFGAFPSGVLAVCAQLDRHPVGWRSAASPRSRSTRH